MAFIFLPLKLTAA